MTKISATQRWLAKKLTNSNVEFAYELVDAMAQDEFETSNEGIDLDDLFIQPMSEPVEDVLQFNSPLNDCRIRI